MIKKILNFKFVIRNCQKGMTYIELIVVLSIFSIMSVVVLSNYRDFNLKIEGKSLSNDIALKIVEAQKKAMSGQLLADIRITTVDPWRPAYGLYFNKGNNKKFIYFADIKNNSFNGKGGYGGSECGNPETGCLDEISINRNYFISDLIISCSGSDQKVDDLSIVFTRPDSSAKISSSSISCENVSNATIDFSSSSSANSSIIIYPSGRIQIK